MIGSPTQADEARRDDGHGKTPDAVIRTPDESLRIVTDEMWAAAQTQNARSRDACWKDKETGHLKSRGAVATQHPLTGFLACAECAGSLHVRKSASATLNYFCTNRHLYGERKCSNARMLPCVGREGSPGGAMHRA